MDPSGIKRDCDYVTLNEEDKHILKSRDIKLK